MLTSSTIPSLLASRLYKLLKANDPPAAGTMYGLLTRSVVPATVASEPNASFGAVSGVVLEVTHADVPALATDDHPAGSAGGVTLSKFSLHVSGGATDAVLRNLATKKSGLLIVA